jgi:hypothetical protein
MSERRKESKGTGSCGLNAQRDVKHLLSLIGNPGDRPLGLHTRVALLSKMNLKEVVMSYPLPAQILPFLKAIYFLGVGKLDAVLTNGRMDTRTVVSQCLSFTEAEDTASDAGTLVIFIPVHWHFRLIAR